MAAGCRSVLVVSLGGLGDFITRWPLWRSARRTFPGARIVFLGEPRYARLLLAARLCDEAEDFGAPEWAAPEKIRRPFDLVISVLGARGAEWTSRLLSAVRSPLVALEPFPGDGARIPVGEHIESELAAAGLADPGPGACALPGEPRAWARKRLAVLGLDGDRTVAIHPGSGSPAKNWPRGRFAGLAGDLTSRGFGVLLLEGEAERGGGCGIPAAARLPCLELDLLAAILAECGGYVGNDSGVSHLAALMGAPSTVIFGPTDPAVWAPRGGRVTVVTAPSAVAPCAPCGAKRMRGCRDRRCLTGISPGDVAAALPRPFHSPAG